MHHWTVWDLLLLLIAYNTCFPKKLGRFIIVRMRLPIPYPLLLIPCAMVLLYVSLAALFILQQWLTDILTAALPLCMMGMMALFYRLALTLAGYKEGDDDPFG